MKLISTSADETHNAAEHPVTEAFMREYVALCRRHKMAITPWIRYGDYEGPNFHDSMHVVPLDENTLRFLKQTGANFKE